MVETGQKQALTPAVLFVELEGALLATDLVWESALLTLKRDPWRLLRLPQWLARRGAEAPEGSEPLDVPDPRGLPYRREVVEFLVEQRERGRRIVLVARGAGDWARELADHLDLFDDLLVLDEEKPASGEEKLAAIESHCRAHGWDRFAYVGRSAADMPVWEKASEAFAVEPKGATLAALRQSGRPIEVFHRTRSRVAGMLRAMRPQQWLKNLLVFAPVFLAHQWLQAGQFTASLTASLLAFVAFCSCTSSVYITNDLLDITADRRHPKKRHRPFASGELPASWAPPLALALLATAVVVGSMLPNWAFLRVLAIYWVTTTLYSFYFKRVVIADVLLLAGLYSLRILAGSEATGISISKWLFAFSIFLFTSLAFLKRYAELNRLAAEKVPEAGGRGYRVSDLGIIESMGPTSGYMAALVLTLYISSDDVARYYHQVWALWMICPLLVFWVSWAWLMAKRGQVSEDPFVYALTDRTSLLVWLAALTLVLVAAAPWEGLSL